MIRLVNDYAQEQTQENTPTRRRFVFANMKRVNKVNILKSMSDFIAIGAKQVTQSRTTGQHFQPTIAHDSESKAKIEPFVNEHVTEFQSAFYVFSKMNQSMKW